MGLLESLRNRGGLLGTVGQTLTDYQQLANAYPNASKFAEGLIKNLSAVAPPDPRDQQESMQYAINRAFDVPGGFAGTFIGPRAATWNADAAAEAVKKLDSGIDPAQVWQEHMIGRMPDGALFSEIDDSGAKITPLENPYIDKRINADVSIGESMMDKTPMSLDDLLSHSELSKAYFPTRETSPDIWFDSFRGNRRGSFSTDNYGGDMVTLSNKLVLDEDQEKSTLLHELQHAIQNREGWAKGGSAEGGWISDRENVMRIYKNLLDEANKPMSIEDYARIAWGESPESKAVINDYNNSYLPSPKANVNKIDKSFQEQAGREYYRRLTGEAQARATQDRMNMTLDERRNNYPLARGLLSDIPLDQLIYRK